MNPRKHVIKHIVTMGDSLTDRGTMAKRKIWGTISVSYLLGMDKTSPKGRFTNGYTWDDDFGAMLASMFIAKDYKAKRSVADSFSLQPDVARDDADLADDIIDGEFVDISRQAYSLDDDLVVKYKNDESFFRSYAEGGLSAYDYSGSWFSVSFFQRELVSTLAQKRKAMLADDAQNNTSQNEKAETLVVELSGANDFFTVNDKPTIEIAENAISARMENLDELIKNGYSNFVLIGLPDVSLTPKFQQQSTGEQKNMHDCCMYFNTRLQEEINKRQSSPGLSVEYFDINGILTNVYEHPEQFGFNPDKLKQPFTTSEGFKNVDGLSPANGELFWDGVHPTANMHRLIAEYFYEQFGIKFDFEVPDSLVVNASAQSMCENFMIKYQEKLEKDKGSMGGSWRTSRLLTELKDIYVQDERDFAHEMAVILNHAINDGGERTRLVLMELGWIDANSNINVFVPALEAAQKSLTLMTDKNLHETQRPRI